MNIPAHSATMVERCGVASWSTDDAAESLVHKSSSDFISEIFVLLIKQRKLKNDAFKI